MLQNNRPKLSLPSLCVNLVEHNMIIFSQMKDNLPSNEYFPWTLQTSLLKEQQEMKNAIRNEKMISPPLKTTLSLFSLQDMYSCLPT